MSGSKFDGLVIYGDPTFAAAAKKLLKLTEAYEDSCVRVGRMQTSCTQKRRIVERDERILRDETAASEVLLQERKNALSLVYALVGCASPGKVVETNDPDGRVFTAAPRLGVAQLTAPLGEGVTP